MNMNLKKVISSVAALAMTSACFTAFAAGFSDVPDTSAYKNAIDELVALKVVNGYEDGTFKPDAEITRAEVTKMVVAAMGPSYTAAAESSAGSSDFTDCATHWAVGYINVGVAQSFINGMGDGTFSPDTNVTYAQIVKMLVAALGYTSAAEASGGYPNGYLQIGSSTGITTGVSGVSADTAVTRGQVAKLIDNAVATPIVAVTGWTNDIYGKPVATTEVMDGTGDSAKYQTLLTEYHDAYKVKGRVTATHAQGDVDKDKVKFNVEYADNFDGDKIAAGKNKTDYDSTATTEDMYFGDTNAESLLFTYADTLIQKDSDDEYHILAIYPYGTNDIVELASDDYDSHDFSNTSSKTIDFDISSTSSKTKSYKLDTNVALYVNGVYVSGTDAGITSYIDGNKIGTVTLIDTPQEGSSSKDGKYDYIMVTVQRWAVVDSTGTSSTTQKIYFDEYEAGLRSPLSIDTDDDDITYSYTKDGSEIKFEDIAEDNVVLVTYDVTGSLSDSDFYTIDVCDKQVEGKVTEIKEDDDDWLYTVDGTDYSYAYANSTDTKSKQLEVGSEYKLYLDSTGRIVKKDEASTSKNYAVIDRVWHDTNAGEDKVRIIKGDGTRVSYTAKDTSDYTTAISLAYSDNTADGTLKPVVDRLISYKINTKSEVHTIAAISDLSYSSTPDEYKASSTKIGSAKMNDSTQIVDLTNIVEKNSTDSKWYTKSDYTASDIKSASLDTLVDGEEYEVAYGDKSTDGYYRFVVLLDGNAKVGVATHFAIVDSTSDADYDGSTRKSITLYSADSKGEQVTLYVDDGGDISDDDVEALKRGDVVAYGVDSDNIITDLYTLFQFNTSVAVGTSTSTIFSPSSNGFSYADAYNYFNTRTYWNDPKSKFGDSWYIKSGISKWDDSTAATTNGYARITFGAIVDKSGSNLTLAQIAKNSDGDYISQGDDVQDLSLDSDVNVYVYDFSKQNKSTSERLTAGSTGSIVKTSVPESLKDTDSSGNDVYNWTNIQKNGEINYANYAFVKILDGDITDVLVIIPNED